jgi:hypothetical protein
MIILQIATGREINSMERKAEASGQCLDKGEKGSRAWSSVGPHE